VTFPRFASAWPLWPALESAADSLLLRGENADTVQRTLITVNDRIRAVVLLRDTKLMLFVYYSGPRPRGDAG
jgi:hypothetical protein